jgi:radical SAM superfamily enzyme YgiQ (UPF0313 family)
MGFAQPLGFLCLISVLRENFPDQFDIKLIEQALYDLTVNDIARKIKKFKPDIICISCMSVEANEMREAAAICKKTAPDVPVWLGGPHGSVFYDIELESGNVDAVCIGEGERTFMDMVKHWLDGKPLENVSGLAVMKEKKVYKTPEREYIEDLDSLPLPAWDMVDLDLYGRQISMNGFVAAMPWALVFTTRACPYQCIYCHGLFGKKVRKRSVEHVLREIELLTKTYGIKEIHIVDDIFNLDLERAKKICDEIIDRNIKIKIAFPNGLRGDRMDRELIQKLRKAGCYSITYAIETASPRLQERIRKNVKLDKLKEVIAWTDAEGIITQGFCMLGFPGETVEEMKMTIDYTLGVKLSRAWFFTVVIYPRTGLYDMAVEEYPDFDFDGVDFFNLRYWAETPFYTMLTDIDVYKIQRDAYRAFFLRPSIIVKILVRFPKNIWFLRGLYWGLRSVFNSLANIESHLQPVRNKIGRKILNP